MNLTLRTNLKILISSASSYDSSLTSWENYDDSCDLSDVHLDIFSDASVTMGERKGLPPCEGTMVEDYQKLL